jgi:putative transposase
MVSTLQHYRESGKFELHAYVVMPDYVHILLTPAADVSLEKALQFLKGGFSFRLKSHSDIWERGHFDKRVPDRLAYRKCVEYIDQNPVKENLCSEPAAFSFGSAHSSSRVDAMPGWLHYPEAKASSLEDGSTAG